MQLAAAVSLFLHKEPAVSLFLHKEQGNNGDVEISKMCIFVGCRISIFNNTIYHVINRSIVQCYYFTC